MRYPAYPQYRQSDVKWLGEVPEHWEVKRLKYSASTIMGQSPNSDSYTHNSDERPFLQGNAEFGDRSPKARWYCDAAPKTVPAGALLMSVRAPVGAINETDQCYGIGRGLCGIINTEKGLLNTYAWYALQVACNELYAAATGSTYDAVAATDVGNIRITLPPFREQTAIADFLGFKTGEIDTLVAKKRRLIALLREKRAALITRTVTRGLPAAVARECGLEPPTRFKDSGIEWLGEVPEHWQLWKVAHGFNHTGSGTTPPYGRTNGMRETSPGLRHPSYVKT